MLSVITAQSRARPASISPAGRRARSLARCSAAIERPVDAGEREQLARRAERVRHRRPVGVARRVVVLVRGLHEAAADGIVGLLHVQVAARVPGREHEAVGVPGKRRPVVEDEVAAGVERHLGQAGRGDPPGRRDPLQRLGGAAGVEVGRVEAGEAEDHRPVGGVALAGEGEAAVQPAAEPDGVARARDALGAGAQRGEEPAGGDHRPHRVRGGGPDADLEDVEDAEEHGPTLNPLRRRLSGQLRPRPQRRRHFRAEARTLDRRGAGARRPANRASGPPAIGL